MNYQFKGELQIEKSKLKIGLDEFEACPNLKGAGLKFKDQRLVLQEIQLLPRGEGGGWGEMG
ncbi:hypothetical protein GC194_02920 [bacterium]|nr:hypothetical protein [bacterium]